MTMTDNERRKKEFLALQQAHQGEERFKINETETDKKINRLVQASHMLISVTMNLFSEAEDLLSEQGLALDRSLSKSHFYYTKAANNYCREFATMIKTELEKSSYWQNLQYLDAKVRKWSGIDEPDKVWYSVEDKLPDPGKKVVVVTRNGKYGLNSTTQYGEKVNWKGSSNYTDSIVAWMPIQEYGQLTNKE